MLSTTPDRNGNVFQYLTPYEKPKYFMYWGDYNLNDYYPFLGRSRDSDVIEESNFFVGLKELGGENEETVIIERSSHFLVGWTETIYIHKDAKDLLVKADEMLTKINEAYPLLDEMDCSDREYEKASEFWNHCGLKTRIEMLERAYPSWDTAFLGARFELSKAMHEYDPDGRLYELLTRD